MLILSPTHRKINQALTWPHSDGRLARQCWALTGIRSGINAAKAGAGALGDAAGQGLKAVARGGSLALGSADVGKLFAQSRSDQAPGRLVRVIEKEEEKTREELRAIQRAINVPFVQVQLGN